MTYDANLLQNATLVNVPEERSVVLQEKKTRIVMKER